MFGEFYIIMEFIIIIITLLLFINDHGITKIIKASRIRWLCHIFRYGSNPTKIIIFSKYEGMR